MTSAVAELPPALLAPPVMQMLEKDPAARPSSMAVVEAMLCEAQIAAGPAHGLGRPRAARGRRGLAQASWPSACPRPGGGRRRPSWAGALALALAGASAAAYYGIFREPEVVVKYVAVTQTEEAEAVAGWLEKA